MLDWPLISTQRTRLRPARHEDLTAIEMALADPQFPTDLPLARMFRESSLAAWLERMTNDPSRPRLWAITLVDDDTCIGTVALTAEKTPKTWWLSYWLSPAMWSRGLASEAVAELLSAAAQRGPYREIIAVVARSNRSSIRLLERIGFVETAKTTSAHLVPEAHITLQRRLRQPGET